jgi:hypothetical protein
MAANLNIDAKKTLGHVALHYRKPDEGPLAARLMELLGFSKALDMELPGGSRFYQFYVDRNATNNGDGILYLSPLPESQRELIAAIHDALQIGTANEHPAVAKTRAAHAQDPEADFHVGLLLDSLETLEATMLHLRQLAADDPQFKGRMKVLVNRARPGTAEVDARMDASPLYRDVTRYTYGRNGVQAFVETDILTNGPLGDGVVIDLDYVFPGYAENLFTAVEL